MRTELPATLKKIHAQVRNSRSLKPSIHTLYPIWEEHITKVEKLSPNVHIEDQGEVLYLGDLSPGCQTCKDGTLDCIFLTKRCNVSCPFCFSPPALPDEHCGSAFGIEKDQILSNFAQANIQGIGFSGGEVLLVPQKMFDWIPAFKSRFPYSYCWIYTNGLLAEEHHLRKLAEIGLDEIRFNTAATGYDNPVVLRNMAVAAHHIPNVTVEIPAIPEDESKLLSNLAKWDRLGVKYLNLHELMYGPGTNSASMPGERRSILTVDGYHVTFNPRSRALVFSVMREVVDKGLSLSVNDCSLQSKTRQVRGRKRTLAPFVLKEHEKLIDGELIETCCAYQDDREAHFFHPDTLQEVRSLYPGFKFVKLARTVPASLEGHSRWVVFEEF